MRPAWTRLLPLAVSFALCACAASPAPRAPVTRGISFPLRDMRFPSGLRVVIEEDHRAPTVTVFTLVGAGSSSDPPGKEGLAHYVEHLAFRARPDGKTSVRHLLQRAGAGEWNAETRLDSTAYYEIGPKEALPALLLLGSARLLAPVANITPEVAAAERAIVAGELREFGEDRHAGAAIGLMQPALFPAEHPYSRALGGSPASLSALGLDDAARFAKEHYRPENVTIVITGDLDLKTVGKIVEDNLHPALKAGAGPRAPAPHLDATAPPTPPPASGLPQREGPVTTPEIWVGWSLPRSFDAESYLARVFTEIANTALHGAAGSDGDVSNVDCSLTPGALASILLCRAALREGAQPERASERVMELLGDAWGFAASTTLREITAVPLRIAATRMLLDAEDPVRRARARAEYIHFAQDLTMYSRALRSLTSTDAPIVTPFAGTWLAPRRARLLLVTPASSGARGASALVSPSSEGPAPALDPEALRAYVRPPGVASYRRLVLANGLEVILGRREGVPVVSIGLSLHGGASAEPFGAYMMASRDGAASAVVQAASQGGVSFLRSFERDDFRYTLQGPTGSLGDMLEGLSEQVRTLEFTIGAERRFDRNVIPNLARLEQQPEARAQAAFWKLLYGDHPYGRTVTAAELEKLGASDVDRWIAATHVPENATLTVVGAIDPDEVADLVRARFSGWGLDRAVKPTRTAPPPAPPAASVGRPSFFVAHRPGEKHTRIRFGCLLPSASPPRHRLAAELALTRLDDDAKRAGAIRGFHGDATTLRGGAAHLVVEGRVEDDDLPRALTVLRDGLTAFDRGSIGAAEIEAARSRVALRYGVSFRANLDIVKAILAARNQGRSLSSIDAFPEELLRLGAADVKDELARCARGRPVLTLLGDEAVANAALKQVFP